MVLLDTKFASTYQSLEESTPPAKEAVAAKHFTEAFAKYMEQSQAGDAVAVPAALYAPTAMNPFIAAVTGAFKTPPAPAMLDQLDLAITAYITTACVGGLFVSAASGTATAFTPTTPLKTFALPLFKKMSNNGLQAKKKFAGALTKYLGAGQVAFPGPPPVTKPIV